MGALPVSGFSQGLSTGSCRRVRARALEWTGDALVWGAYLVFIRLSGGSYGAFPRGLDIGILTTTLVKAGGSLFRH